MNQDSSRRSASVGGRIYSNSKMTPDYRAARRHLMRCVAALLGYARGLGLGAWGRLRVMKVISLLFYALFFTATLVEAQAVQGTETPTITVTGEATVNAVPDQAWVLIGSEARSKISTDAQQRNAQAMTAVQQKLASLGIEKDAIRTIGIDLQPEFDYVNGKQIARGYVARNTIEVRVDDLGRLGAVLDAAVASGATSMNGLRFDVKNRAAVEQQALQAAVGRANAKAQAVAMGAKRAIDRVLRIEEIFVGGGGPEPVMMRATAQRGDVQTPVSAGEIEIRAQVRLTATFK